MADSTIKNLKEFAFLAVFKDIVYDLLRVRRRHPNGLFVKRRKVDHLHGTSNRAIVDSVRAKLDSYLVTYCLYLSFENHNLIVFVFYTGWCRI
jgi:hypothetical protein